MKIADRTSYRQENGQINILGRVQGMLKFGMAWYDLISAQDDVVSILEKALDQKYILLRNITLPDTEIELPMVLIGPPGVFMINVINDRGVYRARDDEWGMISGEKFVPAKINQVQRTSKLGRVLQIYLERAGFKNQFNVEPILLTANPGMHIEPVRPIVRVVMSDALERFAISIHQAKTILSDSEAIQIAKIIINGPATQEEPSTADKTNDRKEQINVPSLQNNPTLEAISEETLSFSFDDRTEEEIDANPTLPFTGTPSEINTSIGSAHPEKDAGKTTQTNLTTGKAVKNPATGNSSKAKRGPGFTPKQFIFLAGMVFIWLCAMAGFAVYIFLNLR